MPVQVWNTKTFSDREQFSFWREVICEAFGALEPHRASAGDPGFSARVRLTSIETIRCATVEAPAHFVLRERPEIRRDPQEAFFVNLQLGGSCVTQQAGRERTVQPGDFVVLDLTKPYSIDTRPGFSIICFRVPRERLLPFIRDPRQLSGSVGLAGTAAGRIAASFMREMWSSGGDVTDVVAGPLVDALSELIGVALTEESSRVRRSANAMLYSARAAIRRQLANPDLSPALVAQELRLSVRTLHKLFEQSERSFADHVRHERLTRCAADLRNPCDRRSISEISWRWGFNDSAHFSRVFRSAFGQSPRDFRQASLR